MFAGLFWLWAVCALGRLLFCLCLMLVCLYDCCFVVLSWFALVSLGFSDGLMFGVSGSAVGLGLCNWCVGLVNLAFSVCGFRLVVFLFGFVVGWCLGAFGGVFVVLVGCFAWFEFGEFGFGGFGGFSMLVFSCFRVSLVYCCLVYG